MNTDIVRYVLASTDGRREAVVYRDGTGKFLSASLFVLVPNSDGFGDGFDRVDEVIAGEVEVVRWLQVVPMSHLGACEQPAACATYTPHGECTRCGYPGSCHQY